MLLLREQLPIHKLCEVLGVPRSSAYYGSRPSEDRSLLEGAVAPLPKVSAGIVWFFPHKGLEFRCYGGHPLEE
jgi:hypothetical protein